MRQRYVVPGVGRVALFFGGLQHSENLEKPLPLDMKVCPSAKTRYLSTSVTQSTIYMEINENGRALNLKAALDHPQETPNEA